MYPGMELYGDGVGMELCGDGVGMPSHCGRSTPLWSYLTSVSFTIVTDHSCLCYLHHMKDVGGQLTC